MSIVQFHKDSFDKDVLLNPHPVLIDFWAPWCAPCRMQAPILEEVAEELSPRVVVGKVNIDEEMDLATSYSVMSIPTLVVFKGGKEVARMVGVQSKEDLLKQFEEE